MPLGNLFALFAGVSFLVALLQIHVSKEHIKHLPTRPRKVTNALPGAKLSEAIPFCACLSALISWVRSRARPRSPAQSRSFRPRPSSPPAVLVPLLVLLGHVPIIVCAALAFTITAGFVGWFFAGAGTSEMPLPNSIFKKPTTATFAP